MDTKPLSTVLKKYEAKRENLLPILHELNDGVGYISENAMQEVANFLDISATEVYGVATFYHFFNLKPKGKYIIRLCKSISCDINGKDKIAKELEKELKIKFGETTKDKKFTLEYTNCMGMCDVGPSMLINKEVYNQLTPVKVKSIITTLKKVKGGKK